MEEDLGEDDERIVGLSSRTDPVPAELWDNREAARALSLTIPPSVLLRADEVIE